MRKTLTASAKAPAAREYEYGFGLYNGRFQILHEGHVANFKAMAKKCQRPIINIGQINQSRDTRNFLDFQERQIGREPARERMGQYDKKSVYNGNNKKTQE